MQNTLRVAEFDCIKNLIPPRVYTRHIKLYTTTLNGTSDVPAKIALCIMVQRKGYGRKKDAIMSIATVHRHIECQVLLECHLNVGTRMCAARLYKNYQQRPKRYEAVTTRSNLRDGPRTQAD